jgi:hypothetical protein
VHDPGLPQGPEVVADQWLGQIEILDQVAHAEILGGEALHDAPADGFPEDPQQRGSVAALYINAHAYQYACMRRPVQADVIACTLDAEAVPDRLRDWEAILSTSGERTALDDGGLRVELDADVDLAEVARLVVAEQRCCAFFSFAITADERGIGLEVWAPGDAGEIVASLFGQPAARGDNVTGTRRSSPTAPAGTTG